MKPAEVSREEQADQEPAEEQRRDVARGVQPEVAEAAMEFNVQQLDRRLSANSYRALWSAQDRLERLGVLKTTFDVNKNIEPKPRSGKVN